MYYISLNNHNNKAYCMINDTRESIIKHNGFNSIKVKYNKHTKLTFVLIIYV